MRIPRFIVVLLVASGIVASARAGAGEGKLHFNKDIRPILSSNCFYCHGPDEKKREAKLRLDVREDALADHDGTRAIVPGRPEQSELIVRARSHDKDEAMPPPKIKRPPLSKGEIETLRKWIEEGAEYEGHWAFLPLRSEPPPQVNGREWVENPIDRFILARLEREGIAPSPEADPFTLCRRLYLDIIGLLPTPEETRDFVESATGQSKSAAAGLDQAAVEGLVDKLLASPHYGERWGRHWLDQARYADSNGYTVDGERAMWPYRDWVIKAMNDDMPFDQFTIEQLAGDLLPNASKSQIIATAFHRNTPINEEGGADKEQFRDEAVVDRVNTTGTVWLGLTVGCAQCHSHKFDSISQREYYELYSFFNQSTDVNNKGATVLVARGEIFGGASANPEAKASGTAELMVMKEVDKPRPTFIHLRGDFLRNDEKTGPLKPGVIAAVNASFHEPQSEFRNRLDLAKWIVHPDNPLTSRVAVNRIWMQYFGRGLVETDEDFGAQGMAPTHPELLDWLGREFTQRGWSMKAMHRLIATSAAYRQASAARPDLTEKDPRNLLLARQERLRLDAEILRDAALSASGLLAPEIGGPSVHPPQAAGVYSFTQNTKKWQVDTGPNRFRRALYTMFYRSAPYPLFTTFDAPNFQSVCTRRARSDTPLQALTVANDPAFVEMAQSLATRLLREDAAEDPTLRIRRAFTICLSREPSAQELAILRSYSARQEEAFRRDPIAAKALLSPELQESCVAPELAAAMVCVARAILNTDSFITRE